MKVRITLLCLFMLGQFCFGQQNIAQRWKFESIRDSAGLELFQIGESDSLYLGENAQFQYSLNAKNSLVARGSYRIQNDTLVLSYLSPSDTTRFYQMALQGDSLILEEAGIRYSFVRPPSATATGMPKAYNFESYGLQWSSVFRGLLGLAVLIAISLVFSTKRRKVNWRLILTGLGIQFIFAWAILRVKWVVVIFDFVSSLFVQLLSFTRAGAEFLFGSLITNTDSLGYIFAFQVLPTVIFFSALTSLLFYWGILQKIVYAFAWFMKRTMRLSGAESLAAAGNIFLGQTESPLLVKPYIDKMTRSELLCLMSGGMATIAGGVLAAYIGFLGGTDEAQQLFFAKQLLAASVMSAPAAIVAAKLLLPETEKYSDDMRIDRSKIGSNALEALSNGTSEGLKLAVNVGAMLLVFLAVIALLNSILGWVGDPHTLVVNGNPWIEYPGFNAWISEVSNGRYSAFSLEFVLGYVLAPLTWLMGVAKEDMVLVGQLLGEKTILNEFVAYVSLGDMKNSGAFTDSKSIIIATYILCGFSNFASIGIQIGGIGALAPERRGDLSKLGFRALLGGTMASLFTAVIVGMFL